MDNEIHEIFNYWKLKTNKRYSKLDNERKYLIKNALDIGYSVTELKKAIDGCCKSKFNMGGNKQGRKYDSIGIIFKNADSIDNFIENELNQTINTELSVHNQLMFKLSKERINVKDRFR